MCMVSEPGLKDVYISPRSLNHVFWAYIYVHGIQRVNQSASQSILKYFLKNIACNIE